MAHNLFLGVYAFQIRKRGDFEGKAVLLNDFLSETYNIDGNRFSEGFVPSIVSLLDKEAFKNSAKTHGGTLAENHSIDINKRYFDLMINGGITGIKQYVVRDKGVATELDKTDIVGPKFYARIWLPAGTTTGYLFLQRYGSLSIKPLFDTLFRKTLKKTNYILSTNLKAVTTKERQKLFLEKAVLKDITIISKSSPFDTGNIETSNASIKLNGLKVKNKLKDLSQKEINKALEPHGFSIKGDDYEILATYENKVEGYKEEKTVVLDGSEETFNIVPNIFVPKTHIDSDNYPIFEKMKMLVDREIVQIKKESKF